MTRTHTPSQAGFLDRMARFFGLTEAQDTARLNEEKRRLEALLGAFPAEFCGWDMEGVQAISPGFAELLNSSAIDSLDDVARCLSPEYGRELLACFRTLENGGVPFQIIAPLHDMTARVELSGRVGAGLDGVTHFHMIWVRHVEEEPALMRPRFVDQSSRNTALEAMNQLPFPLWLRGPDGTLDWVNETLAQALGQPASRVVATGDELAGDEGRDLARIMRETATPQSRDTHIVLNGERKAVRLIEQPAAHAADPSIGAALDRSEAETAQRELQRRTEAQRELLDQLNAGVAFFGPNQRLEFHNRAYARLFGLEETWLNDTPSYMEVLENLRERRMVFETGDFREYRAAELAMFKTLTEAAETLQHLPDGRTLRRVVAPHPLGGLMIILEDVTSSLSLESSFKQAMAVQRETLDNLVEGVAVIGTDGRLKLFNPAFEDIWGISRDTLDAEPHIRILSERMAAKLSDQADAVQLRASLGEAALNRSQLKDHLRFACGRCLDFQSRPLPDGAVLLIFVDVTAAIRMEETLRDRTEVLEAAERQTTNFLAAVSKKLRDPLTVIMGYSETLKQGLFGPLSDDQAERMGYLYSSANELNQLVNDVLDLASINAGKLELEPEDTDIGEMLEMVAKLTREWAGGHHVRISVDCPDDIGNEVLDPTRIKQAIMQLVNNAIDYTEPGGKIELRAGRGTDGTLWIEVQDDGVGIPDNEQERLLGRRGGGAMGVPNDQSGSLGVGLALVRSIVGLHQGNVKLVSNAEDGTCITLHLPRQQDLRQSA